MKTLRVLLSLVFLIPVLLAQPSGSKQSAGVVARLRFITLNEISPDIHLVIEASPKVLSPVSPGLEVFSPEYSYSGPVHFFLFDQSEPAKVEGAKAIPPKPVGEITLPGGGDFVILMSKNDAANGLSWRFAVINYGVDVFPGGSVRVINYAKVAVAAMVNEKELSIPSGGSGGHKLSFVDSNSAVPAKIGLAYQTPKGDWAVLFNTVQRMPAKQRLQVIVLNSVTEARPKFLRLVDYAPEPPVKLPAGVVRR